MQPAAGKTILPIFNKKKRPRQAIFTYPNNGNNSNAGRESNSNTTCQSANPAGQQPGYMQPRPPQRSQTQSYNNQTFQNRNSVTPNKGPSFKGTNGPSHQPGFLQQNNITRGPASGRQQTAPNRNMMPNANTYQRQQQQQQSPRQSSSNNKPRYNQTSNGGGTGWSSGSYGRENNQPYQTQQGNSQMQRRPSSNFNPNSTPSKRQYTPSSTTSFAPNQNNQAGSNQNNQAGFGGQHGFHSTVPPVAPPQNMKTVNTGSKRPSVLLPFQGPGTEGVEGTATTASNNTAFDKTEKIVTSSIEGMRHWAQHTESLGMILFEMFGMLNSAITTDDTSTAKLFNLKEGQHSQRCIFFETDRNLQRPTRGQWLRCVGSLDKKTGLFRVVKVRPINQQEQEMYKAITAKCDQAMNEKLVEMQEQ